MVSDRFHDKAQGYRATAERIRLLAGRLRFSEARHELFDLADRFERLAVHREATPAESASVTEQPAATVKAA